MRSNNIYRLLTVHNCPTPVNAPRTTHWMMGLTAVEAHFIFRAYFQYSLAFPASKMCVTFQARRKTQKPKIIKQIHWPDIPYTIFSTSADTRAWVVCIRARMSCLNMLYCCDSIQIKNVIDVRVHISRHTTFVSLLYPLKKWGEEEEEDVLLFLFHFNFSCYLAVGTSSNFIISFGSFFCCLLPLLDFW